MMDLIIVLVIFFVIMAVLAYLMGGNGTGKWF